MKPATLFFLTFLILSCSSPSENELDFLVGTWKRENREQYEVWEKRGPEDLKGYSYRIKGGQQTITETLTLSTVDGQWVLEATVPDQNEGQTVRFSRNPDIDSLFSFENLSHDFPKKIQYKPVARDRVEVLVLGKEGQGFSYFQFRQ